VSAFRPVDPKQSFPELEQRVLEGWRQGRVFERSLENRADAPIWSFYEGPPTANGKPGSHHVLSRVFKDIYPRYKTMTGHRVPRKAGWDCHGLPVELEIEKELGINAKAEIEEYGIAKFNAKCRESVFRYVEDWNRLTERIGFWIDLDDPYVTLEDDYIESVWWALRTIWDKGRMYESHKVVPYCPRCGTALSSHEVALGYQDVVDPSVYVELRLNDAGPLDPEDKLLIWTTTPWTLPGNVAVAVGPDVAYARVRSESGQVYVTATARVEHLFGPEAEVLDRAILGAELAGEVTYAGPIFKLTDREPGAYPVIAGDFVTTDDGTGLVHIAPAFGEDDYDVAAANGIFEPDKPETLYVPVKLNGRFDDRVVGFEDRFVKDPEVTAELIADLSERGLVLKAEDYEHAYPHCWRCDTPLLYYAKASWYIRTTEVRDRMLAENEKIDWHPSHIREGRFGRWLENNVDWALSRDRYWGTPLPIWRCDQHTCTEVYCAGSVSELRQKTGGEMPEDLHRPYIDEVSWACEREGCDGTLRREAAVIDTWFDSGAMPFAQFHYPFENEAEFKERFPADFICEAIDQTRGWFYTLLAESSLLFDQTSYKACVCLGLILDPEGRKMSKSQGNVVEPWDVIDRHGADAFRWYYLTAQQPWAGYRFSIDTVGESVRQFLLPLWNTYSFWVLYANSEGIGTESPLGLPPDATAELDRWALSRLQATVAEVRTALDAFDSTGAGRAIAAFVAELSNWYVRLCRRRFWDGDAAAFATLRHCLVEVAALLAPFMPFVADEIHANLVGGESGEFGELPDSVHLRDYPQPSEALRDPELETGMAAVRLTVELGRAARAQAKIKIRQPLRKAVVVANDSERAAIERLSEMVARELNVKEVEFVAEQGELVSYRVKPNYRSLGPRFGKDMPMAAEAIEALDANHVAAALESGAEFGVSIDGHDHNLSAEDVTLAMQPLDGYEVEAEAGHAVALSLELDHELRGEGLAREIVHAVQNARREAGLEVSDRIALSLGGDEALLDAARAHEGYLSGETLATSVAYGADGEGAAARIDGLELRIGVEKA
jgi:isoleucyl-tRNA synthetase